MATKDLLSEQDVHAVRRQWIAILNTKEGRELGRWFLTERGKDEPDMAQIKRELFDVLNECVDDLYSALPPVNSRGY
jgi:hypothetical protein